MIRAEIKICYDTAKKMPKIEGQRIIRVSAHAILQSNTLYTLEYTHNVLDYVCE